MTPYAFDSAQHGADLFDLKVPGNIYTRIMNPTQEVVEQRVAALEGGTAALMVSSGQAAETFAVLNIAGAGDHIVSSTSIFGATVRHMLAAARLHARAALLRDESRGAHLRLALAEI